MRSHLKPTGDIQNTRNIYPAATKTHLEKCIVVNLILLTGKGV